MSRALFDFIGKSAPNVRLHALVFKESNVLLPRKPCHDPQTVLTGKIQEPRWRTSVGPDAIDAAPAHMAKISSHDVTGAIFFPASRSQWSVSDAAKEERFATDVKKFSPDRWTLKTA